MYGIILNGLQQLTSFQGQVHGTYIKNLKKKEHEHFGTGAKNKGPLETQFRRLDFKPLLFGTFGETSTYVKVVVDMAVEYGVEHLGRSMSTTSVDAARAALRRRFRTQLAVAIYGYANLTLYRINYVGTGHTTANMAHVRAEMQARADAMKFRGV